MKTVVELNGIPNDAKLILNDTVRQSILIFDGQEYTYDSGRFFSFKNGWTMVFKAANSTDLHRFVVKTAQSHPTSQRAKTSVLKFLLMYPQKRAAFGNYIKSEILENKTVNLSMDVSVLPYLGNDLGFLKSERFSQLDWYQAQLNILIEFERVKIEWGKDFRLGNLTASNIIISADKQVYFIDQYRQDSDIKSEFEQLRTIFSKNSTRPLPAPPTHTSTEDKSHKTPPKNPDSLFRYFCEETIARINGKIAEINRFVKQEPALRQEEVDTLHAFSQYVGKIQLSHAFSLHSDFYICLQSSAHKYPSVSEEIHYFIRQFLDKANQLVIFTDVLERMIQFLNRIISEPFMKNNAFPWSNSLLQEISLVKEKENFICLSEEKSGEKRSNSFLTLLSSLFFTKSDKKFPILKCRKDILQSILDFLGLCCAANLRCSCKALSFRLKYLLVLPKVTSLPGRSGQYRLFIDLRRATLPQRTLDKVTEAINEEIGRPGCRGVLY